MFWVTFDSSGLCSLDSDPTNVVDPNVGFQIKAADQTPSVRRSTRRAPCVRPTSSTRVRHRRYRFLKFQKWEWPVQFDIREHVLNVVFSGVKVASDGKALRIGDVTVKLEEKGRG